jgi:hypothetical protein
MAHEKLAQIVLQQMEDHGSLAIKELVQGALEQCSLKSSLPGSSVDASDVKSVVLGLVRRHKLELTDDFKVRLP